MISQYGKVDNMHCEEGNPSVLERRLQEMRDRAGLGGEGKLEAKFPDALVACCG